MDVLKDIVGWRGEIIYFKENKLQSASHWKVPADTCIPLDPEESQELNSCPRLRNSPRSWHGPVSIQGGSAGCLPGLLCFVIHAPLSPTGWQGCCSLSLGTTWSPSRLPLWILLSHLLGGLVTLGTSFPLWSCVLFVGSSWSHPWGRMGVGGLQRQLGFFSWWVAGLKQS